MERDAKYAAVAAFALLMIAAAFAFVWWYSGHGDTREYGRYEIYFEGSVSGLSQGSPVRYLGVDVGRVVTLKVNRDDPGRVKVLAEIDSATPLSGATRARLGLLGLTGLLYIDLQLDPDASATQALARGDDYPVIESQKGNIEAFLASLPDFVGRAGAVMARIETLLGDENLKAVGESLSNIRDTSAELPQLVRGAGEVATELRATVQNLSALAQRLSTIAAGAQPDLEASLASMRLATERLAKTAESLDRIVAGNEATLTALTGPGVAELQQVLVDVRDASAEFQALARTLRERPSSIVREPQESGVEIAP
jgi:phospholipid/cholesterol/gamma-HCH transport system substrate-binding protein